MKRRHFLQTAAAASLISACRQSTPEMQEPDASVGLDRIGVGLFTIPLLLEQDFAGTIEMLAGIGYKEVEMYGPYPYSVQEYVDYWNTLTPQLGFSGSGYFGHTAQEVRQILDDNGMTSPSMHIDIGTLEHRLDEAIEAAQIVGQKYAGLAAIPDDRRQNLDGYKRMADLFNEIGSRMSEAGMKFLYHNHGYGLVEMEGEIPLKVILERTDPNYVALEMDIYWTTAGRADPIAYLNDYPGRYKLMHLKDMTEMVHFKGDGGTADQWMELFPKMADAGAGVLDLPGILSAAKKNGVEHFYLERDMAAEPDNTLRNSYAYLASV